MDKSVVVAIGNNQARFFTLEQAEWPEYESGPNLVEQESLSYSPSKYGQDFWLKITKKYDRKAKNSSNNYEFERKFAQKITSNIINLVRINQSQKLILVAPPQILKIMYECFTPTLFDNLQIRLLKKDIHQLKTDRIHHYLAKKQLIPAYQKAFYPL